MYLRDPRRRRRRLRRIPRHAGYMAMQDVDEGGFIKGIDVSQYQGAIDWAKVRADGIEFAFIKATDGLYQDPFFTANWKGAGDAGVLRSPYHFFRPAMDADQQAQFFLSRLDAVGGPGEIPPAIDVETADGISADGITAGVRRWIDLVQAGTSQTPIFYSTYPFWLNNMGAPDLGGNPLWLAQVTTQAAPFWMPNAWDKWSFWQWSWTGHVSGINAAVDLDRFNGTRAELENLGHRGSWLVLLALAGAAAALLISGGSGARGSRRSVGL